jgi:small subunit ribosomal protein S14
MARKALVQRELKRQKLAAKYAAKRAELKQAGDSAGLAALPRNSSKTRLHNRCQLTGRPRGYMRQFGMSRIAFREHASRGQVPGVTKASW